MIRLEISALAVACAVVAACSGDGDDASQKRASVSGAGAGGSSAAGASGGSSNATGGTGASGGSSAATGGTSGTSATGGTSDTGGSSGSTASGGSSGTSTTGGAGNGGAGRIGRGGRNGGAGMGGSSAGDAGAGATGGSAAGKGGGAGSGGTGMTGSGGAAPSDGCSGGTKPARGHYTITVGSTERGYYLIPATADGPVPLVLEFHGAGGNGEGIASSFGIETSLMGHAVIIAPDGVAQGNQGIGWSTGGNNNPDIDLVKALIAQAKQDHCIDESRIYSLGFSWGGWMSTQVACSLGSQIRAFLSVAGGGPMGNGCNGPVAAMIVHGTADGSEPISSGMSTRDKFRSINGCSGSTLGDSSVTGCQQYSGCTEPVLWCQHDGDHYIPQFVLDGLPAFFASVP